MAKNQHVVPRGKEWAVRGEGNGRLTSVHSTQAEAIEKARSIARRQRSEVVIHRTDGRVRDRDSFSTDRRPPKSPRKVLFPAASSVTNPGEIRSAIKEVLERRGDNNLSSRETNSLKAAAMPQMYEHLVVSLGLLNADVLLTYQLFGTEIAQDLYQNLTGKGLGADGMRQLIRRLKEKAIREIRKPIAQVA